MDTKIILKDIMASGRIYKIFANGVTDCYIGSTRTSLEKRLSQHVTHLLSPSRNRQTECAHFIFKMGISNIKICLLEEMPNCTDQELWNRERYRIDITPSTVNKNMPQPEETNQSTQDGKKAYMLAYRAANAESIAEYTKEYRSIPEVKTHNTMVKREWTKANSESLNAKKKERITCDKCKTQIPVGHKHEHTSEKCNKIISDEIVRQQHRLKAKELFETLTLRDIVKHPYFVETGKFKNHSEISRLLKELTN